MSYGVGQVFPSGGYSKRNSSVPREGWLPHYSLYKNLEYNIYFNITQTEIMWLKYINHFAAIFITLKILWKYLTLAQYYIMHH
jgi:hypothetical protein